MGTICGSNSASGCGLSGGDCGGCETPCQQARIQGKLNQEKNKTKNSEIIKKKSRKNREFFKGEK
jgi:hypothetical protein